MVVVVFVVAVVDQDHTSSSDDLSNQDYKCWSKDYIVVVAWHKHQQLVLFLGVWNMHLLDDQEHNIYHTTLVDWLPSYYVV